MPYSPPFQLTHKMISLVASISELLGRWSAGNPNGLVPILRRENRIRTIQASLAVEHNTLTLEQVTAVIEGKTVLGTAKEIQEVHNAFAAYEAMPHWQPYRAEDLLEAHCMLMYGLITDAGQWRNQGVGIYRGEKLVHMAPPVTQVPRLMAQLLAWLANTDAHPLIASTAFHYELEFIHPFSDGNGRIGRLWQTLILSRWHPLLAYLPVETMIKHHQPEYYRLLNQAALTADCSAFIEFLLDTLQSALQQAILTEAIPMKMQEKTLVEIQVKTPEKILLLLQQNPNLTLSEVAKQINRSSSAVERAVAKLKQQGKLTFHGAKKNGAWEVKTKG
ncbi:Fic family protein [Testudinibacter sp. TR-2022]|uniref:Fic family protein n=1 Tax=Testudinibacter sp. TR-2022 TaxID=2585029 RepID=UPI0011195080|nr:Fic family protein [Testudinibacter sp. TR-2022]TNH07898.1 Fic family protein [Pasteurellaceae bacterium Phil11]TNH20950.1 Fic family protein [Testudinibacter sp. TR-2022]TNH28176.1 Fic family protein [Testudinibacter sp. TR-2022]